MAGSLIDRVTDWQVKLTNTTHCPYDLVAVQDEWLINGLTG